MAPPWGRGQSAHIGVKEALPTGSSPTTPMQPVSNVSEVCRFGDFPGGNIFCRSRSFGGQASVSLTCDRRGAELCPRVALLARFCLHGWGLDRHRRRARRGTTARSRRQPGRPMMREQRPVVEVPSAMPGSITGARAIGASCTTAWSITSSRRGSTDHGLARQGSSAASSPGGRGHVDHQLRGGRLSTGARCSPGTRAGLAHASAIAAGCPAGVGAAGRWAGSGEGSAMRSGFPPVSQGRSCAVDRSEFIDASIAWSRQRLSSSIRGLDPAGAADRSSKRANGPAVDVDAGPTRWPPAGPLAETHGGLGLVRGTYQSPIWPCDHWNNHRGKWIEACHRRMSHLRRTCCRT
jgi:hypothetical protein